MEKCFLSQSDVIIAGGGVTGLALSLALRRISEGALRVTLCAPNAAVTRSGPRTSALAEGPRRMFETLGVWRELATAAQAVLAMEIGDARLEESVRRPLLRFQTASVDAPLAHMVFHRDLEPMLLRRAQEAGVELVDQTIAGYETRPGRVETKLADGRIIAGRLLVAADGAGSRIRACSGIKTVSWPYDRLALVATISHERDHDGRAVQHFFPGGPFAVLPVTGRRSSIVWTERTAEARRLLGLNAPDFLAELRARIGGWLGAVAVEEEPAAFPLTFQIARAFTSERLALVGDAAHRVHPLAGQGLNLGLRDVATLVDEIMARARLGLDVGSSELLAAYGRRRRFDATLTSSTFDLLHRLFKPEAPLVRGARSSGMALTDQTPALKRFLEREASGLSGDIPTLFQ